MIARLFISLWIIVLLDGCVAHEQRCDGKLRPINVPLVPVTGSSEQAQ